MSTHQKGISVVVPYFNQEEELGWFLEPIMKLNTSLVELVVVDDHSRSPIPLSHFEGLQFSIKVIRIESPVKWGMTGASNWGVVFSTRSRILKLDIDHRISEDDLLRCTAIPLDRNDLVRFPRFTIAKTLEEPVRHLPNPHSNSFLITRDSFLENGMFDERYAGHYGYDDKDFFRRIKGKMYVRVEESISLETNTYFHTPGKRNRSVNRIRFKMGHPGLVPRRLLRSAQLLYSSTPSTPDAPND